MRKHNFSNPERYAVWMHHDKVCYWCGEPLRFQEATVDHIIPENLIEKPAELEQTKKLYGLSASFQINDYCNWVPCHEHCNKSKSSKVFTPAPILLSVLDKTCKEADKVRKIEERVKLNVRKDKLLAKVAIALEAAEIDAADLQSLIAELDIKPDEDTQALREEVFLHLDSGRWGITHLTGDIATVTDGKRGGMTPVCEAPHPSWYCPYCGSCGPWNGIVCMSCGMMSDPFD